MTKIIFLRTFVSQRAAMKIAPGEAMELVTWPNTRTMP